MWGEKDLMVKLTPILVTWLVSFVLAVISSFMIGTRIADDLPQVDTIAAIIAPLEEGGDIYLDLSGSKVRYAATHVITNEGGMQYTEPVEEKIDGSVSVVFDTHLEPYLAHYRLDVPEWEGRLFLVPSRDRYVFHLVVGTEGTAVKYE
jgi:hypothetical protein